MVWVGTLMYIGGVMISYRYPVPDKAGVDGSNPSWPTIPGSSSHHLNRQNSI
jgi:hypothetical protein